MPAPLVVLGGVLLRAAAKKAIQYGSRVAIPVAKKAIKKYGPKLAKKAKDLAKKAKDKAKKAWDKLKKKKTKKKNGSCESCKNRAQHEKLKDQYRRQMQKPHAKDPKLKKQLDELYRKDAKIGNGSTADAVRHERLTGQPVGGKWHTQKAQDGVKFLDRWLKNNPKASPGDRAAAQNVMRDLQNALSGK